MSAALARLRLRAHVTEPVCAGLLDLMVDTAVRSMQDGRRHRHYDRYHEKDHAALTNLTLNNPVRRDMGTAYLSAFLTSQP